MIANAFFATTVICMALGLYLLETCQFLIPYRTLLLHKYAGQLVFFAAASFINLFAAIYALTRWLFLKDTGRKLAHLEKQLRTGSTISEELSQRLKE
jgi:hypothetical protein